MEVAELGDGSKVALRAIEPGDRAGIARGFERMSDESRYRRFLTVSDRLSNAQLDYLTRVDHHDHEALIAFEADGGDGAARGGTR